MIAQSFTVPLNMAFAETLTDFDDVSETNEFPSIVEQTEADELKDETFHFSDTYLKGKVSEPIIVKIFSNSEYLSVPITLPEEAQIVEEKLPEGISIKQEAQLGRWLIESVRPQDTFDIPLFFEVPGKYQVSVLEKILVLEIEEEQPTNDARDTESEENNGIFPDEDGIAGQESVETGIDYEAYSEHLELFNEVFEGTPLNENRKVIVDVNNLQDYFHFIGNAKNSLASHRSESKSLLFRPLEHVEINDLIYITDLEKVYIYSVSFKEIVNPESTYLIEDIPNRKMITLVTCDDARGTRRLVIQGELIETVEYHNDFFEST